MSKIADQYADDLRFLEWLNRQFNATAEHATAEDLAEFAFGDVEAAITAYKKEKNTSYIRRN